MNSHALSVLEFPRVLELVAGRASSDIGAARVRTLAPATDREWIDREHARVAAVRSLVAAEQPWHPEPLPDLSASLGRLRVIGLAWSGPELLHAATLLRSSRRTRDFMRSEKTPLVARAVLAPLVDLLVAEQPIEDAIGRALTDDGAVRDDASPALARIRRELRASQGELVRILERAIERLDSRFQGPDMSVTVRGGRYVIPVRREGRGAVGGIVHDVSSTGATLFVEPPAAIDFGNRIRELEGDEQEEVERILLELTDRVRPLRDALISALDALTELDTLYARARYALEFRCGAAEMSPARDGFSLRDGRHPLLLAQGIPVVPFDLEMKPDERTLLVSGPNTGGKTVLLKAIGLLSAMMQAGIPAPVGAGSRVALFDDCYADIGDEQSIEASLSTFSAHLRNLSDILRLATRDSLVLIDELGSGTDPQEGAALGWAILESLTSRGTSSVATTHLGTLKDLAGAVQGVVNASLQFDAAELAPTYRLVKGIPGRSYGIAIARRLSLPHAVVERAEQRLPQQERDIAALIERLEKQEKELAARDVEVSAILDDARRRIADVAKRERNVRERERGVEKQSRQDARRYLLDARREIDRVIKDLKKKTEAEAEEAAREARRKAEDLAEKQSVELERLDREEANVARRIGSRKAQDAERKAIAEGDFVSIATLEGKTGRVLELRDSNALVSVGPLKMTVPVAALAAAEAPAVEAVAWTGDLPEVHVATEIDVRGMRADEVESIVLQALDAAVRADLRSLRIIHGKGTGALRERVAEMLQKDSRVKQFRLGAWNEGGAGVTVAEF